MNPDTLHASVELRHLRYFIALAEEFHFGRAARRLNIAQPALSQQIRQFERSIGAALFVRTTRRVELTPAGQAFLPAAYRTVNELECALNVTRGNPRRLRVGYTAYSAIAFLPALLRHFRVAHAAIGLDLVEDCSRAHLASVERNLLDIGFVSGPYAQADLAKELRIEVVYREPFYVAIPEGNVLRKTRNIALRDLAGLPMVLFPPYLAPAFHEYIRRSCAEAGFVPHVVREAAGYDRILEAVSASTGVSLVPASVRLLGVPGVKFLALSGTDSGVEIQAVFRSEDVSTGRSGALPSFLKTARLIGPQSSSAKSV